MLNIDLIEISIDNIGGVLEIFIDPKKNLLFLNGTSKSIGDDSIETLIRIIKNWNNYYGHSNSLDDEKFLINITIGGNIETIKSDGIKPDNYNEFKEWIGTLYE